MNKTEKEFYICKCNKYWGIFQEGFEIGKCPSCEKEIEKYTPRRKDLHKIYDGFYKISRFAEAVYVENINGITQLVIRLDALYYPVDDDRGYLKSYNFPERLMIEKEDNKSVLKYYFTREEKKTDKIFYENYKKATRSIYKYTRMVLKKLQY